MNFLFVPEIIVIGNHVETNIAKRKLRIFRGG